ncbi:hypothetical protein KIN20_030710 [Parelaphostrongylus tenuis]|uniref:Uncharacterized protein n=1 Tax=Parelaphostrongylus tenuis TaxID=148309 RepID=A0AAD5WGP2_PARTN|nr:hypothetical protein KIN20_030710 [Parelaphostrongylus tenuis]
MISTTLLSPGQTTTDLQQKATSDSVHSSDNLTSSTVLVVRLERTMLRKSRSIMTLIFNRAKVKGPR